jgi:hypothetical protein
VTETSSLDIYLIYKSVSRLIDSNISNLNTHNMGELGLDLSKIGIYMFVDRMG